MIAAWRRWTRCTTKADGAGWRARTAIWYWTPAHHASGGCDLWSSDLFGTGTISGPGPEECGSLLEATKGRRRAIALASGEERRFLEDGDEVEQQS